MQLATWLLLCDFGLVVLIWIVQLVIYPSFHFYPKAELLAWHSKYTAGISFVVVPLMFGQLGAHLYNSFSNPSLVGLIVLAGVIACWVITFAVSVPLHGNISSGTDIGDSITQLVRTNWSRTIIWTLVFIGSLYRSSNLLFQ